MFFSVVILALIGQQVKCAPAAFKHEADADKSDVIDWQEYYLKKYENNVDEDALFSMGDDWGLKEYYDYVDHMDEEERAEILNMLHQEKKLDRPTADGTEPITDEISTDAAFRTDDILKSAATSSQTDDTLPDGTFTSDSFTSHGTNESPEMTFGARDAHAQSATDAMLTSSSSVPAFQPIPLSGQFDHYDVINKDGSITLEELAQVTGARENIRQAFQESDINGDGVLNEEEFRQAPWYRMTEAATASHNGLTDDTTPSGPRDQ